jgi:hypothetical protein
VPGIVRVRIFSWATDPQPANELAAAKLAVCAKNVLRLIDGKRVMYSPRFDDE